MKISIGDERLDHLYQGMLDDHAACIAQHYSAQKAMRMFRRHAYRFAVKFLKIERHWHNDFVDLLHAKGKSITEWLDTHFEVIEATGEKRTDLFAAIEEGMAEREYVRSGRMWLIDRNKEKLKVRCETIDAVDVAAIVAEKRTDGERVVYFGARYDAEHALRMQLQRQLAIVEKELKRTKAVLQAMEKKLRAVIGGSDRKAV